MVATWQFPWDVPGWLTEAEGRELAKLADGRLCIEIGSYCGRSSICMAQTAELLMCVDTFDGRGTASPYDTFEMFKYNALRYGVAQRMVVIRGTSNGALRQKLLPPELNFAFIDGAHDYFSVIEDGGICLDRLWPRSPLCFHDYESPVDPEVKKAVDALIRADRMKLLRVVDSIAVCERC